MLLSEEEDMSRLQVVLAVGLFLIVALFGWKTYLEKASQKNKSDQRGLPTKFQDDVKAYKKANPEKPAQPKVVPARPAAPKTAADRTPKADEETPAAKSKDEKAPSPKPEGKPAQ